MSAIGGYYELELQDNGSNYHDEAIAVNTGRNALEYILRSNKKFKKILIPHYICDVILQPIKNLNLEYEYYHLDDNFLPKLSLTGKYEVILYVNYFGIMNEKLKEISKKYVNIIIDNSQAFYTRPLKNIPTFYSPRKFFGLPDGGFAYSNKKLRIKLQEDQSFNRYSHLVIRIENGPEAGFNLFKENDKKLDNLPLKKMSNLTKKLLRNVKFKSNIDKRNKNFTSLHSALKSMNEFTHIIDKERINGPMVYPFLKKGNNRLRKHLIKNKIYVATYWPNVHKWADKKSWEYYLTENLIPLPIDQRYNLSDMKRILEILWKFI